MKKLDVDRHWKICTNLDSTNWKGANYVMNERRRDGTLAYMAK